MEWGFCFGAKEFLIYVGFSWAGIVGVGSVGGHQDSGSCSRGAGGGEVVVYRHDLTHSCHRHGENCFLL